MRMVNHTFGKFQLIFGRRYSSRFGNADDVALTKRMWAQGFTLSHVNPAAVDHAINRIIVQQIEWPPELPDFLALCDESLAAGLPSPETALKEIICRRGAERFNDNFAFSHRVVEYTNEEIGHYLHKEAEKPFNARFKKAYRQAVYLHRMNKLPPKRQALPAPELPPIIGPQAINPNCPIQKRMAQLRKAARSKHSE